MNAHELENEEGFSIIEVLVAAFILVLGALAVFMTFAAGIHNIQRARETQVGVSVAQREIERIRVLPYEDIGMKTEPPLTLTALPPLLRPRLSPSTAPTQFDLIESTSEAQMGNLVWGGDVVPVGPEPVSSPDGTKVEVFRFVVCDPQVTQPAPDATCPAKRIVVDVQPVEAKNLGGYKHNYYELQSTIVEPGGV